MAEGLVAKQLESSLQRDLENLKATRHLCDGPFSASLCACLQHTAEFRLLTMPCWNDTLMSDSKESMCHGQGKLKFGGSMLACAATSIEYLLTMLHM